MLAYTIPRQRGDTLVGIMFQRTWNKKETYPYFSYI